MKELREIFEAMESHDKQFMDAAEESMRFYTGSYGEGHWEQSDLDKLQEEQRSPLQLNIILPKVNMVAGIENQNRTYWKTIPIGTEDAVYTKLITPALLYVERQQNLLRKFSRSFKYAALTGRDWLDIRVEDDDQFGKDVVVKRESWSNVLIDPDARSDDISEWVRLARKRWLTVSEVNSTWDLGVKNVKEVPEDVEYGYQSDIGEEKGSKYSQGYQKYLDADRKRVKVIDYWDREWERTYLIADLNRGITLNYHFDNKKNAREYLQKFAEDMGIDKEMLGVISKSTPHVYHTQFSGDRVLKEREKDIHNHKQFPLVPVFYYFEDMGDHVETLGLVENLKDPQREKDKRRSQALDVLSRTPKGGGIIDQKAGITSEQLNEASSSGKWAFVALKAGRRLSDIMQQWSMGHLPILNYISALEERSEYDAKEISGATDPLMGVASAAKESGLAANTRIRQGLTTLEEPLNSLDNAKKLAIRMIISNMQQFWSTDKFTRVIGAESDAEGQDIQRFVTEFKQNNVLQYDVTLVKTDSPTVRSIRHREIGELIQKIPQYAPALLPALIDTSDWESREEILQSIEQIQMQEMMKGASKGS